MCSEKSTMWDFDITRTFALMARTLPFIFLRMLVYFTITFVYILVTGTGAGIGWGVGSAFAENGAEGGFAFWGGLIGFGAVTLFVYWVREYILYLVKAAHIAVLVQLLDNREIPDGQNQLRFGREIVTARFAEANVLFVVDQLVKAAIRAITGLLGGIAAFLPIPGLDALVRLANSVIRMSLTYVDEIILGYNIRVGSNTPFETAQRGVILYAQNGRTMVKNAVWLAVFMWILSLLIFLVMIAPAGAVFYAVSGQAAGWTFILAMVFAWAVKAALLEPFAIAALMDVYFKTIEGQQPDPEWDRRLTDASRAFRELKEKAATPFGRQGAAP
jgi:hypothetical protein